jgi:hypothetical protein
MAWPLRASDQKCVDARSLLGAPEIATGARNASERSVGSRACHTDAAIMAWLTACMLCLTLALKHYEFTRLKHARSVVAPTTQCSFFGLRRALHISIFTPSR